MSHRGAPISMVLVLWGAACPSLAPQLAPTRGDRQRAAFQVTGGNAMLGTWEIVPPAYVYSPSLAIVIDSARGDGFWGRLTRARSGDLMIDVNNYLPLSGTIGPDSVARATIPHRDPGVTPVTLAGPVRGAEWRLTSFVWGGDEQGKPNRSWKARRS